MLLFTKKEKKYEKNWFTFSANVAKDINVNPLLIATAYLLYSLNYSKYHNQL